jgi:sugar O-acyltransferase (sialic acid O-acetyltransferase NeuD family)
MIDKLIGVYGASGFGREVMPVVKSQISSSNTCLAFIDDAGFPARSINGYQVYNWEEFLAHPAREKYVVLAIADARIRILLTNRCHEQEIPFFQVVAPSVILGDEVTIGDGSILQPFVNLTSNIIIGQCFQANIYSYVAHDCKIGDFVTFAPGVMCNGNVHVGDRAYIGTGAVIKQGTPEKPLIIGADAIVGMGAVVTKNVPDGVTVVGNPARILER